MHREGEVHKSSTCWFISGMRFYFQFKQSIVSYTGEIYIGTYITYLPRPIDYVLILQHYAEDTR